MCHIVSGPPVSLGHMQLIDRHVSIIRPLSQPGIVASFICKSSLFDDQPPPKSLKEWEQALLERATQEWGFKCVPRLAGVMVGRRERASC